MFVFLLFSFCSLQFSEPANSIEFLRSMYERYHGSWYKTLTFVQKNEFYHADTLAGTSIWYEAIEYPGNFRIDIGNIEDKNGVIFRNDSIYSFKDGELKKASPRRNDLTFLLGGMYFIPFDSVKSQMKKDGYDLSKGFGKEFNGRKVWIVGANNEEEQANQLWIDSEHQFITRVITFKEGKKVDALFENHQKLDGGWCESKVTFYIDDKLVQIEYYTEPKVNVFLDEDVFNPSKYGTTHWYRKD